MEFTEEKQNADPVIEKFYSILFQR